MYVCGPGWGEKEIPSPDCNANDKIMYALYVCSVCMYVCSVCMFVCMYMYVCMFVCM